MHAIKLRKWALLGFVLVIASSSLACGVVDLGRGDQDDRNDGNDVGSGVTGNSLAELVGAERLDLESVSATGEGIQGQVLMVQLTNPGNDEVIVTIPCGFYFSPGDDEEQRLMVIQPASVSIPAGGTATVEPYVICIDSSKAGPEASSTYHLGEIVSGDLLKLAECLCQEELPSPMDLTAGMDAMGVQFAVWAVSDGILAGTEMIDSQGALEELLGGELGTEFLGEEFTEMLQQLMLLYGEGAQPWLDRCGIELDS
jgi:hypothetical protein